MTKHDYTYYRGRALQEDEAARLATCKAARERHLELADAYRTRCIFILATIDTGVLPSQRTRSGAMPLVRPVQFHDGRPGVRSPDCA